MQYLKIIQILIAVLLITVILLQNRGGGLGGAFGGGGDNVYMTKRGFDKKIFVATIVLSVIFFSLALLGIVL